VALPTYAPLFQADQRLQALVERIVLIEVITIVEINVSCPTIITKFSHNVAIDCIQAIREVIPYLNLGTDCIHKASELWRLGFRFERGQSSK
jgi:hypothetical protein